jgi:small subunit ribosomal protein S10
MAAKKAEKPVEAKQKLRIKLKAYDHKLLDASCRQIVETAMRYGVKVIGPIPLPNKIRRYTVNRSSFVHKKAREQFEVRTHKRLIEVSNPNQRLVDGLMNLNLPSGVNIEVKV